MNRTSRLTSLLAFNGGFVDTVGLLGLHGLFLAHVTGNLVTLAASLALNQQGIVAKALALPEFAAAIALTRLAAHITAGRGMQSLMFGLQVMLLALLFLLAVALQPSGNSPGLLFTAGAGVAAMAMQNALLASYRPELPPTTFMSGNAMRAVTDAVDLLFRPDPGKAVLMRTRLQHGLAGIASFAIGCGTAGFLLHFAGFWCLLLPVAVGAVAAVLAVRTDAPAMFHAPA
jgi:uncharacterized membrane protein YoaK (UPF0700 family)